MCLCICVSVCVSVCHPLTCFANKSRMNEWILIILTHMIDIDETLKLTQGQGDKVKGQGQLCNNVKNKTCKID